MIFKNVLFEFRTLVVDKEDRRSVKATEAVVASFVPGGHSETNAHKMWENSTPFKAANEPKWAFSETEMGMVRLSDEGNQMTLEIPCPNDLPYLIRGHKLPNGCFSGRHDGQPGDTAVLASWREVGDRRWEGMWHEADTAPMQFAFRLP